jgi:hypothetical protein
MTVTWSSNLICACTGAGSRPMTLPDVVPMAKARAGAWCARRRAISPPSRTVSTCSFCSDCSRPTSRASPVVMARQCGNCAVWKLATKETFFWFTLLVSSLRLLLYMTAGRSEPTNSDAAPVALTKGVRITAFVPSGTVYKNTSKQKKKKQKETKPFARRVRWRRATDSAQAVHRQGPQAVAPFKQT